MSLPQRWIAFSDSGLVIVPQYPTSGWSKLKYLETLATYNEKMWNNFSVVAIRFDYVEEIPNVIVKNGYNKISNGPTDVEEYVSRSTQTYAFREWNVVHIHCEHSNI